MIGGIVASAAPVNVQAAQLFPQIKAALTQTHAADTTHTVALPAGWAHGDLCVIVTAVGVTNSAATNPEGWTRQARMLATGLVTTDIYYRILQAGDAAPGFLTTLSSTRASCVFLVSAGSFSTATPISTASSLGFGAGAVATAPAGSTTISANSLALYVAGHGNTSSAASVSAFPWTIGNQQASGVQGSSRFCCATSFRETGPGTTPAGGFQVSPSSTAWRAQSYVILSP